MDIVEIPLQTCESIFVVSVRDVLTSQRVTSPPRLVAR
jgi:hypothetical protein